MNKEDVTRLAETAYQFNHEGLTRLAAMAHIIDSKDPASLMCKDALRALIDRLRFINEDGPLSLVYEQHAKTLFAYAIMVAP